MKIAPIEIYKYTLYAGISRYKWKVHHGKMDIISIPVKCRSQIALTVNFYLQGKVCDRVSCICDFIYLSVQWDIYNYHNSFSRVRIGIVFYFILILSVVEILSRYVMTCR